MNNTTNTTEEKRLLLYRLTRIIKALYPTKKTQNPFNQQKQEITQHLDPEDTILLSDLLHCLTLLNGNSRINEKGELISTQTDWLNAVQLILPEELKLTPKILNAWERLKEAIGERPFDNVEACSRLKLSQQTFKRYKKPLLLHGLIIQQRTKGKARALFQIVNINPVPNTSQQIFEDMQGEWKNFVGFMEF